MSDNQEPISLDSVRNQTNELLAQELEALAVQARAGELVGALVFKFGHLPRTVAHDVLGHVSSGDAVFGVERWKHQLLAGTFE